MIEQAVRKILLLNAPTIAKVGDRITLGDADTYADTETWTKLAAVVELTPPVADAESVDVSHMESEEQYEEKDPGWASVSDVEATIQHEKAKNETVLGLFRQVKGWKVVFSDGSHWGFTGFLASVGNEVERKGIVTIKVKITISGKPTFVKAA